MSSSTELSEGSGPLSALLKIIKSACDEMSPMVRALYEAVSADTADTKATKQDNSAFTIADGVVQHLLVNYLFAGGKFRTIVGEEDSSNVNIEQRPYSVDNLHIPADLFDLIDSMKTRISDLGAQIDSVSYKDKSVFIDPIDGTREFTIGQGEQCTILVGISSAEGRAEAGIIHRPIPQPPEWVIGCAAENCRLHNLALGEGPSDPPKLATTQTKLTPFTEAILQTGMDRFPIGGAGNKILVLMEGKASAFITDKPLNRWDTCGPEAVLEAFGGMLVKLSSVLADPSSITQGSVPPSARYTYLQAERNLDLEEAEEGNGVAPYLNLCGSFMLSGPQRARTDRFVQATVAAAKACPPTFRK